MGHFGVARNTGGLLTLCWLAGCLLNCGGSAPKVSKDSPEYQFSEAKQALVELNYEGAISFTGKVINQPEDNPYEKKARLLRMILVAGLSDGHRTIAEAYLAGSEKSMKDSMALRAKGMDYYRKQKNAALAFLQAADYFVSRPDDASAFVLECDFPAKDIVPNRKLDEVRNGVLLDEEERRACEAIEVGNGVIVALSSFLGAGDDRAKARKLLETGSIQLDPADFMVRIGRTLITNQKVFGRTALNEVQNYRQLFDKAVECSEVAQKLLKQKPNPDVQAAADDLKVELEAQKKKSPLLS
ncbi:MAG: hypothetical protein AB1898_03060 [Acidobacteriota bacterium]